MCDPDASSGARDRLAAPLCAYRRVADGRTWPGGTIWSLPIRTPCIEAGVSVVSRVISERRAVCWNNIWRLAGAPARVRRPTKESEQ